MSDEYGSDFIQIVDEDGTEYELELLDTLVYNDVTYMALIPAGKEESGEEDDELIILKVVIENGEEILSTPDDDDELDNVYNLFMDRLFEDEEEDGSEA